MWLLTGNSRVTSYLERSLEKGALSHAFLFTGPRHIGKMTLALELAQAVNCAGQTRPCGECSACQKISGPGHPDVQIIRLLGADESDDKKAKNELVIEQIRKLQHWASLPPYEGRCRVFIFEQADMLNEEAANCLLKTLEEPLPNVLFILLAPDENTLPETIVSRCQRLDLKPVPAVEIEELLLSRGLNPERAGQLARLAAGAPGWAIDAGEHEDVLGDRTERLVRLVDLVSQGYEERFEAAEALTGKGAQSRSDASEVLKEWRGLWRDLILIKTGQAEHIANLDFKDKLTSLSATLSLGEVRAFIGCLSTAIIQARQNVNARLIMEVLMLDMPRVDKAILKG